MFSKSLLSKVSCVAKRAFSTEIPVTQVATLFTMNVQNEANAIAMDKMFHEAALPAAKNSAGFIGNHRTVCKSEWAYETAFVWDSLDNYLKWKESDVRADLVENTLMPKLEELGIKDSFYAGVRVFDQAK